MLTVEEYRAFILRVLRGHRPLPVVDLLLDDAAADVAPRFEEPGDQEWVEPEVPDA